LFLAVLRLHIATLILYVIWNAKEYALTMTQAEIVFSIVNQFVRCVNRNDGYIMVDETNEIIKDGLFRIHSELIKKGIVHNFVEGDWMDEEDIELAIDALMTMYSRHYTNNN
jgi:hypothetical protein